MVLSPGNCCYMLIGNKSYDNIIILNGVELKTSNNEKLPKNDSSIKFGVPCYRNL